MHDKKAVDVARSSFYEFEKPARHKHLFADVAYDNAAAEKMRDAGWKRANSIEGPWKTQSEPTQPSMVTYGGELSLRSQDSNPSKDNSNETEDTRSELYWSACSVYGGSSRNEDDDGWVSDDEGPAERGRISPCTFSL